MNKQDKLIIIRLEFVYPDRNGYKVIDRNEWGDVPNEFELAPTLTNAIRQQWEKYCKDYLYDDISIV